MADIAPMPERSGGQFHPDLLTNRYAKETPDEPRSLDVASGTRPTSACRSPAMRDGFVERDAHPVFESRRSIATEVLDSPGVGHCENSLAR
jgi:hypothetical protein